MKPFLLIITLLFSFTLGAQNKNATNQRSVSGQVTSATGEPIEGVSIKVKGSSAGTTTNAQGNFSITFRTAGKHTLVVSYVGYTTKEVVVDEQATINIQLEETNQTLDDVVVVGYGKQKKSDVTGAVTSISKDRIENMVRTDVTQLIQGAAPGVNVAAIAAGSNPENGSVLLIRGRNSISASNDPLIILDGIPYNGTLSDINPNDIESIEILKDASAAAIYGSRASNGVILIQTVKADKGKMRVKYDAFLSFQSIAN
ncbi:MAG TPA: TonB-dependent receptor plug domain-containing protein, partial [Chitinophagaceae bacterium]|nr:TonB-dependent receptor plug domain-containing protein [Chitinophagaceae bacterium]